MKRTFSSSLPPPAPVVDSPLGEQNLSLPYGEGTAPRKQSLSALLRLPFPGAGRPEGCPPLSAHPAGAQKCVCAYFGERGCSRIRDGGRRYPREGIPTMPPSLSPVACWKLLLCVGLPASNVWGTGAVSSVGDFPPSSILPFFTALFFLNKAGGAQRGGQCGKKGAGLRAPHLSVRGE